MAPRLSSEPRSTSNWLRREDAPSVIDSMESSGSIWSTCILADSAISDRVASSAPNEMSSGRGPPDGAEGAAAGAAGAAAAGAGLGGGGAGAVVPPPSRPRAGVGGDKDAGGRPGVGTPGVLLGDSRRLHRVVGQ